MPTNDRDKPTFEEYPDWYEQKFGDILLGGKAEQWYERATTTARHVWEQSPFWKRLQRTLESSDTDFKIAHNDYSLFHTVPRDTKIHPKPFQSVLNKSFRWNVRENDRFDQPPRRIEKYIQVPDDADSDDSYWWFSPQHWFLTFPDILRTRLVTTYFDGVRYLADRLMRLAKNTSSRPPILQLRASQYGYFAAHVSVYQWLTILDYEHSDPISVCVPMEIQVTTTIQEAIGDMLHLVYDNWRINGPPKDWEWDHKDPAFSVNYLGSTLHYLEGMIVMARDTRSSIQ